MIPWLAEASLWGAALLPLVWLLAWRCANPSVRHLLFALVLIRLLLPSIDLLSSRGVEDAAATTSAVVEMSERPGYFGVDPDETPTTLARWIEMRVGQEPMRQAYDVALYFWLAGAFLMLLIEGRGVLRARAVVKRSRPAPVRITADARRVAELLGAPPPRVVSSAEVELPFVWGLLRPTLVVPRDGDSVEESVLIHELMHVRRRDGAFAILELLAAVAHWWNPVFWVVRHRMRLEAEMACDAGVIDRSPEGRLEYARLLVDAADRVTRIRASVMHTVIGDRAGDLSRRVEAIVRGEWRRQSRWPRLVPMVVLIASTLSVDALSLRTRFDPNEAEFLAGLKVSSWTELYERGSALVAEYPEEAASWRLYGMACLRLGRLDDAERAFQSQLALDAADTNALYNLACLYSVAGRVDESLDFLRRAVSGGFGQAMALVSDPDLARVRRDPRFEEIVAGVEWAPKPAKVANEEP